MTTRIDISSLPMQPSTRARPNGTCHGIGIDLGTTNSALAVGTWDPSDPMAIQVRCAEVEQPTAELGDHIGTLVPSVVAIAGGNTFVGEGAKRLAAAGAPRGLRRNRDFFFETKNEMGTDRRYPHAPEGYRSPGEIGGHVLRSLKAAADVDPGVLVVTVPASFQVAQRFETVAAAAHAGFDLMRTQLLDEPLAAFIDFMATDPSRLEIAAGSTRNVLVFDFGGGTCDIAVLSVARPAEGGGLEVAPRSISRFHRLGGGDIDAAVVYDVLIPQLLEQNGLGPRAFGFAEKRNQLEPALRPIAEGLKIGLCQEQARRERLGLAHDPGLHRRFPGRHTVAVNGRSYDLTAPVLSAGAFNAVLLPFLDRNMLAPRADEYRTARSIFAPIDDAIERSGLAHDEIDLCLAVGGSASIPRIAGALQAALPRARVVTYEDAAARKECVARGAAIAATLAAVTGRRVITPVCHDAIGLQTRDGIRTMVPRGSALPWPAEAEAELTGIQAPRASAGKALPLRLSIRAGTDGRPVFESIWELRAPVRAGEPISVRYRLDADQVLQLRLLRPEHPGQEEKALRVENPLTHVQNPILKEVEAERLERLIAGGGLTAAQQEQRAIELVGLLDELGQREKALAVLRAVQARRRGPDAGLLNRTALVVQSLGDQEEACRLFEQSADADGTSGAPLFNLSLNLRDRRKPAEAMRAIDRALEREAPPPFHTLRAMLAAELRDRPAANAALEAARGLWPAPRRMSDWILGWYGTWAREAGDDEAVRAAERERRRRARDTEGPGDLGELPAAADGDR